MTTNQPTRDLDSLIQAWQQILKANPIDSYARRALEQLQAEKAKSTQTNAVQLRFEELEQKVDHLQKKLVELTDAITARKASADSANLQLARDLASLRRDVQEILNRGNTPSKRNNDWPTFDPQPIFSPHSNSTCSKCGIKLEGVMGYYCPSPACPTGLGGPVGTVTG